MTPRHLPMLSFAALLAAAIVAPAAIAAEGPSRRPDGGLALEQAPGDHDTRALIEKLAAEARANIDALARSGRLPAVVPKVSGLSWPLGPNPGIGRDWHGVSNFVDLNSAYPDQLLDYNSGTRTYDTESGYNHRGIDYFVWPFPWK